MENRYRTALSVVIPLILLVWSCVASEVKRDTLAYPSILLEGGSTYKFANLQKGASILNTRDDFINSLSSLDEMARMGISKRKPSKKEFLEYISSQVEPWSNNEIKRLKNAAARVGKTFASLKLRLNLPKEIYFIKTSGKVEGGAAHTRMNSIVLPHNNLKISVRDLEIDIAHETFHILTRGNPDLREKLYAILGFKKCNDIRRLLPNEMQELVITNPDAPYHDYFKQVSRERVPFEVVPILVSKSKYNGGSFFDYINKILVVVEGKDSRKKIKFRNGKPITFFYSQVTGLYDKLGRDTDYNYHPEEVLAKYFEFLYQRKTGLKDMKIVHEIRALLS